VRVAILEDDPDQAEIVSAWLTDAGHSVEWHEGGNDFLRAVRRDSFDLYVLDWMVPDLSGIEVLRKLRGELEDYTPVVIATARDEEQSVVRGLEAGADDYLVKPVRRAELVARVRAIRRRMAGGRPEQDVFEFPPYEFRTATRVLRRDGEELRLTTREFDLALFLFRNAGKVVSRGHILEAIWGIDNDSVSTRTVDTHVSRLRKKLQLGADQDWNLSAVYQHGYRMEEVGD